MMGSAGPLLFRHEDLSWELEKKLMIFDFNLSISSFFLGLGGSQLHDWQDDDIRYSDSKQHIW